MSDAADGQRTGARQPLAVDDGRDEADTAAVTDITVKLSAQDDASADGVPQPS